MLVKHKEMFCSVLYSNAIWFLYRVRKYADSKLFYPKDIKLLKFKFFKLFHFKNKYILCCIFIFVISNKAVSVKKMHSFKQRYTFLYIYFAISNKAVSVKKISLVKSLIWWPSPQRIDVNRSQSLLRTIVRRIEEATPQPKLRGFTTAGGVIKTLSLTTLIFFIVCNTIIIIRIMVQLTW